MTRLLTVGAPHGAERAVFRTAANCLHRCPHIAISRHEVPPGRPQTRRPDAPCLVDSLWFPPGALLQHGGPRRIPVATDDGVRSAQLVGLVRVERRVNTAVDNERPLLACELANLVAAQGIGRVNPDSDHVARLDLSRIEHLEGFISEDWVAPPRWCRCCQDVQPPWRDNRHAERDIAWIDEMDSHRSSTALSDQARDWLAARGKSPAASDRPCIIR